MIQDTELFKLYYHEVWSYNTFPHKVVIYYSPRRDNSACIIRGDKAHFFRTIRNCIAWAVSQGYFNDSIAKDAQETAEAEAEYLDRLDVQKMRKADKLFHLGRSLSEAANAGDAGTVERIFRGLRDKWSW